MSSKKIVKEIQTQNADANAAKYPTTLLLKSEALKCFGLHYDVIHAILYKQEYSIEEAKQEINKYLKSFNV